MTPRKPGYVKPTQIDRFWAKVDGRPVHANDCWLWTGALNPLGYGRFWVAELGRQVPPHRFAYEQFVGPIPEGMEIDHLCRTRNCVNPRHLEPVTKRENIIRGESLAARNARKTHCIRGHEFTPENTYLVDGRRRQCRKCIAIRGQKNGGLVCIAA